MITSPLDIRLNQSSDRIDNLNKNYKNELTRRGLTISQLKDAYIYDRIRNEYPADNDSDAKTSHYAQISKDFPTFYDLSEEDKIALISKLFPEEN